jgi:hypothetical protein
MTHKNRKSVLNVGFFFWGGGTEGFSPVAWTPLNSLGISKLQFLIKKMSAVFFFILGHQNPGSGFNESGSTTRQKNLGHPLRVPIKIFHE